MLTRAKIKLAVDLKENRTITAKLQIPHILKIFNDTMITFVREKASFKAIVEAKQRLSLYL